jgi:hypothetical protein
MSFPPSISNGLQHHMTSIENGIPPFNAEPYGIWCWVSPPGVNSHQEDEKGGRIAYRPPPKPSRASQRHGKDDGNTAQFCSTTAQERPRGQEQKTLKTKAVLNQIMDIL